MFVASVFDVFIVQPIFNLLVFIYGLIPGHNFGISIILFTIVIRLLMWPLVKKQLHQAKTMRELQPELKRIKKAASGNRQQESAMTMELYKERGINPFAPIGTLVIQMIIFIGLYSGLNRAINNPQTLIDFSYGWMQNLSWLKELATNIDKFDATLLGIVDLSRPALEKTGGIYLPAMVIVLASAVAQFFQSKQLLPNTKDSRKLRDILKSAGDGKQADQSEVSAAVGRSTIYILPVFIILFTVNLASALSLYWLVGGIVAILQQGKILNQDETELEAIADAPSSNVIEGEIISNSSKTTKPKKKSSKKSHKRKRR